MKSTMYKYQKENFSTMSKKIILTVVLFFTTNIFFAQQSVFDKFDGQDDVTAVIVNKKNVFTT
jgi:hypothetical protein